MRLKTLKAVPNKRQATFISSNPTNEKRMF